MIRTRDYLVTRLDDAIPKRLGSIVAQNPVKASVSDPDLCLHCRQHQCIAVCPTGSLSTRADGRVALDAATCCGCASCVQVCREFTNLSLKLSPDVNRVAPD
jgi:Fe-S-cluster-containing dehydrogenase component